MLATFGEERIVDAHGEGIDSDDPVSDRDVTQVVLIPGNAVDAAQEVTYIVILMKPDQVGPQHPLENLPTPGEQSQQLKGGEGDV